jgi:(S)-sulfolactate dehydrogenase
MKRGAILVNTSRGGVVDELAVAQALRDGRLGGAALDVFAAEPLVASPHFAACPNLILTPHVAGVTAEANERVSFMIADRVLATLGRQPTPHRER